MFLFSFWYGVVFLGNGEVERGDGDGTEKEDKIKAVLF